MRAYLPLVSSPVARKRYTSPTRATVRPCWGVQIIGFIGLVSSLFCGQCLHELRCPLDPALQLLVGIDAFRGDQHPALHRPPRDVEIADVRFLERLLALLRAEPHDEGVLPDPHEHVAVQQEADAAEHLLRLDPFSAGQSLADAPGQFFAEGHRCPRSAFFAGQPAGILSGWADRGYSVTTATGSWP